MIKTVYQILAISLVSICFGVAANSVNPHKIAWTGKIPDIESVKTEIVVEKGDAGELFPKFDPENVQFHNISLERARKIFESQKAVFLDARYPAEYKGGRIAGAVNFPVDMFDEYFEELIEKLDPDDPLVIYCSGPDCDFSKMLAENLKMSGYTKLMLFEEGYPAWSDAGYPVEGKE